MNKETQAIAGRFAHELYGPLGAIGHSVELVAQKLEKLLPPTQYTFVQAGLSARLAPSRPIAASGNPRLAQAIARSPSMARLTRGLGPRRLAAALTLFELGFALQCSQLGLSSAQGIIRSLRTLGDFARPDLLSPTSLSDTLHAAWLIAAAPHVTIQWQLGRLPVITANSTALTQVWANLFTNAAQLNPRQCHITVQAHKTSRHIQVSIANTGIALPTDIDLFTQGATRRRGGRGLGLHLCRQIITSHGGTIHAATGAQAQGAIFTIQLPLPRRSRA